jgi:4-amino-4-deoxychorismate lyase
MTDEVLIDGTAVDGIWLEERAFQFGDGLFETIAIVNGWPCLWDAHMRRLTEGCQRLKLPQPDPQILIDECTSLSAEREKAVLKVYWTAGRSARGYRRPQPARPRRILQLSDWQHAAPSSACVVRLCAHRLSENRVTAQIKHLNRLDQVIARAEWDDAEIGEGLMLGQDGRVVSGTMSNLFVQRGGMLATPAIEGAGIAGVVRDLTLNLAANSGQAVEVTNVSIDAVHAADALYLTNSLIGVVRVGKFETTAYDGAVAEHPLMTETRNLCHRSDIPRQGR